MKAKFKEGQVVLYQNGTTFGNEMPPVKEYLSAQQRDGKNLEAADIYKNMSLMIFFLYFNISLIFISTHSSYILQIKKILRRK